MTADEVKDAHDRIWAVREKAGINHISVFNYDGTGWWLRIIYGEKGVVLIPSLNNKYLATGK